MERDKNVIQTSETFKMICYSYTARYNMLEKK